MSITGSGEMSSEPATGDRVESVSVDPLELVCHSGLPITTDEVRKESNTDVRLSTCLFYGTKKKLESTSLPDDRVQRRSDRQKSKLSRYC